MRLRRKLYLICYDICGEGSERRLRRVYRLLRAYGEHVQRSVFRCVLSDRQLAELEQALQPVLDHRRDQVLFVPLGSADSNSGWQGWTMGVPLDAPERTVRII
ncbi:MAG TPA: CRISPR-associated endonuclease Cas2 [Deltaproteobacteria bacterium]|nr:CRISPR-associated endonuclease Cas2 [Deltaproteobacteria bacterium]